MLIVGRSVLDLLRETPVEAEIREQRERADRSRASGRLWRAVTLSPRIEICEALLRGESVPIEVLDREQVGRFGRREHR